MLREREVRELASGRDDVEGWWVLGVVRAGGKGAKDNAFEEERGGARGGE